MLRIVITIFFINTSQDMKPFNQASFWFEDKGNVSFILIPQEVEADLTKSEPEWVYDVLAGYEGSWSGARLESYAEAIKAEYHSDYAFIIFIPAIEGSKAYAYNSSYAVIYDSRKSEEATIAHEIGHLLGAYHSIFPNTLMSTEFFNLGYMQGSLAVDSRQQMNFPLKRVFLPTVKGL